MLTVGFAAAVPAASRDAPTIAVVPNSAFLVSNFIAVKPPKKGGCPIAGQTA
jgi:hypothetical protein